MEPSKLCCLLLERCHTGNCCQPGRKRHIQRGWENCLTIHLWGTNPSTGRWTLPGNQALRNYVDLDGNISALLYKPWIDVLGFMKGKATGRWTVMAT
ncbi:unnamed protein product [Discosporangium mesarthrocarpum]